MSRPARALPALVAAFVVGGCGLLAGGARCVAAEAPALTRLDKEAAKAHYKRANKLYHDGNYRDARDEFHQAYDSVPEPTFLFNVGQCSRQLGEHADAARSYRAFLEARPQATNRVEVEHLIADEEKQLQRATPPAPTPTPEVKPAIVVAPEAPPPATPPASHRPKWFWPTIGGAAALVVVAVIVVAVAASSGGTVDAPDVTTTLGTMSLKFR